MTSTDVLYWITALDAIFNSINFGGASGTRTPIVLICNQMPSQFGQSAINLETPLGVEPSLLALQASYSSGSIGVFLLPLFSCQRSDYFIWSEWRESNPRLDIGNVAIYH